MTSDNILSDIDPASFDGVMDFRLTVWEPGRSEFQARRGPQHLNRNGAPHGGVVAALLDAAGMYAGNLDFETRERVRAVTVSMSCNFIGALKGDLFVCQGALQKAGRSTFFAEARLTDGIDGPLVATSQGAYKYIRDR